MSSDLVPPTYVKVPTWRRSVALGVDLLIIGLLSSLLSSNAIIRFFSFILFWLALRVVLVTKNQGQSLGRWAFDQKVIDPRFNKLPGILELSKRELMVGMCCYLATLGFDGLVSGNAGVLLYWVPITIDSGRILFDTTRNPQTFHDRLSQTLVIGSRRGYSLNVKILKWVDKLNKSMK
ncbi:MAG: RDD family protein [Cyanobacteria bacterium J06592_8]